jgi:hypothetical protein
MSPVAAPPHVTLSGDIEGKYVVEDRRPDGRLVLIPEIDHAYPRVEWADILARSGGREMTPDEFEAFVTEHGPHMQPPDGEG